MPQTACIVYLHLKFNCLSCVLSDNPNNSTAWTEVPRALHQNLLSPSFKYAYFWAPTQIAEPLGEEQGICMFIKHSGDSYAPQCLRTSVQLCG